jgi:peptidoglycan/xylan/chitin deacetylase (PgdA/CDA1 family)
LRRLRRRAAAGLGVGLSRLLGSRGKAAFGILMYHRVTPWSGRGPAPSWNVTPPRFQAQLAGLLTLGYEPWSLRKVLNHSRAGRAIPRRTFVVTFDDGYEGVYRYAWPILRELKIPATVFVATAYLDRDGPFPFDDWPGAGDPAVGSELWRPLRGEQCIRMLADRLMDIGCHTHTHQVFRDRADALYRDLVVSVDTLRSRFGLADATFAFPYGLTGPDLTAAARRAGLLCSLTTQGMLVRPGSDPFTWGRFAVEEIDTAATIAAQLDGWCTLARNSWQRLLRKGKG